MMNRPPQVLLNTMARLQAAEILGNNNTNATVKAPFSRPADEQDRLFNPAYDHPQYEDTCFNYDEEQLVYRNPRNSDEPRIHYGLIASPREPGDEAWKDA